MERLERLEQAFSFCESVGFYSKVEVHLELLNLEL